MRDYCVWIIYCEFYHNRGLNPQIPNHRGADARANMNFRTDAD